MTRGGVLKAHAALVQASPGHPSGQELPNGGRALGLGSFPFFLPLGYFELRVTWQKGEALVADGYRRTGPLLKVAAMPFAAAIAWAQDEWFDEDSSRASNTNGEELYGHRRAVVCARLEHRFDWAIGA